MLELLSSKACYPCRGGAALYFEEGTRILLVLPLASIFKKRIT
jgi:hypothetical protein